MRGFVANTDDHWYRYLSQLGRLDEVNFWKPSGSKGFRGVPGSPFFFKLKKPHYAIGGFGFFAHSSQVPSSLAWEAFGTKNGAPNAATMRERIVSYRKPPSDPREDPVIGCILVSEPVFFSRQEWVECRERVAQREADEQISELLDALARPEPFGRPTLVRPGLGQGTFRIAVADAYGRSCAVRTEHSLPALEAAHIRPYGEGGEHSLRNGILLRSDIHRLFDRGYVTVTPDHRFRVSPRLRDDWANGRSYYGFDDHEIQLPRDPDARPGPELLEWHSCVVDKG